MSIEFFMYLTDHSTIALILTFFFSNIISIKTCSPQYLYNIFFQNHNKCYIVRKSYHQLTSTILIRTTYEAQSPIETCILFSRVTLFTSYHNQLVFCCICTTVVSPIVLKLLQTAQLTNFNCIKNRLN